MWLHGCQGHLIHTEGPGQRMLLHSINIFLFTDEDAALGASQKLVAGEKHHVCPIIHRIQDCGSSTP